MPGYLVHLACCNPVILRHFVPIRIGIEAPDLLRAYSQSFGKIACDQWEQISVPSIPPYKRLEGLITQEGGTHFGKSNSPNIQRFINSLDPSERDSPFWRGYLWHLITDAVFYKRLNIATLMSVKVDPYSSNREEVFKREREELHKDWDRTNSLVESLYHVRIPDEVRNLNLVKFSYEEPRYVNREVIKSTIDSLRVLNPLADFQYLQKAIKVLMN